MECIVAHDSCEGRLDHVLANIDTLFRVPHMTNIPVYLVSGDCVSCLLGAGKNVIEVTESCRGRWCSLVPIGRPCQRVTITGLKYNLSLSSLSLSSLHYWDFHAVGYHLVKML